MISSWTRDPKPFPKICFHCYWLYKLQRKIYQDKQYDWRNQILCWWPRKPVILLNKIHYYSVSSLKLKDVISVDFCSLKPKSENYIENNIFQIFFETIIMVYNNVILMSIRFCVEVVIHFSRSRFYKIVIFAVWLRWMS